MALLTFTLLVMTWKMLIRFTLSSFTEFWFLQRVLFIFLCLAGLSLQVYDIVIVKRYLNSNELHGRMGEVPFGIRTNPAKQIFGAAMFLLLIRVCFIIFSLMFWSNDLSLKLRIFFSKFLNTFIRHLKIS